MKLKNLIVVALLLAIGTVLHAVFPGLIFGMKSDLSLVMLFLALYFFADIKTFIVIGLVDGILAGLTTSLPGGFIPNVVDKLVTSTIVFFAFYLFARYFQAKGKYAFGVILAGLGTVISGTIFLTVAILVAGLPAKVFGPLFVTMVLPTALVNLILLAILYPIIVKIGERSGFIHVAPKPSIH
ncbi:tryptophan transporter [Sporolactobacillus laevolacticus]|uniref:Tryptophan transporter n=1 Tax=Sporolactobacillus laevolacticus DSM 442 TaxID=1395513 RepID=V6J325_9BACL|nr:tryptophan transporter [Sporolactobacillus laevolacticus]EST13631.1 tryptophan transporter [Sporolactobacillus laevolacticus DSM 442]MDN3955731.1 tryptophan transporter [Sporolactobacillus laevolacticus]